MWPAKVDGMWLRWKIAVKSTCPKLSAGFQKFTICVRAVGGVGGGGA